MRKQLKWFSVGVVALYLIAGFIILPWILQLKLPGIVNGMTKGHLKIEDVDFNPLVGRLDLENVEFLSPDEEPFAELGHLTFDVDLMSLVFGKIEIDTILFEQPRLIITRHKEGTFSYAWLVSEQEPKQPLSEEKSTGIALPHLVFRSIVIHDGRMQYNDLTRSEPYDVTLGPINLVIHDFNTKKVADRHDRINFYAGINDGGALSVKTDLLSLEPLALKSHITYDSGALYTQWKYLKEQFAFEVADGKVEVACDLHLDLSRLEAMRVENLHAALTKLRIKSKEATHDMLRVSAVQLDGGVIEPFKQQANVQSFTVDGVRVYVQREQDGTLDWQKLMPVASTQQPVAVEVQTESNSTAAMAWQASLERFDMDDIQTVFTDRAVVPNVTTRLDNLAVSVRGLTTEPGRGIDYNLSMMVNDTMRCQSHGVLKHTPLNIANMSSCNGIALSWFDPYVNQAASAALKHYDVTLADGKLGFETYLHAVDRNGSIGLILDDSAVVLDDLLLKERNSGKKLAAWRQMRVDGIEADTFIKKTEVGSFLLDAPQLYVRRDKPDRINWLDIAIPKKQTAKERTGTSGNSGQDGEWEAGIKTFAIKQGQVTLKDSVVENGAELMIDRISLSARNISSKAQTQAGYDIKMRFNRTGTVAFKGSLQHTPLKQNGSVILDNIPLQAINPYLQEQSFLYLEDGKLSCSLKEAYAPSKRGADLHSSGELALKKLAVHDARDDTKLLGIEQLRVKPLIFEAGPENLFIEEVLLEGLYANAVVDANRSFNMAGLKKERSGDEAVRAKTQPEHPARVFPLKIVRLQLHESSADFADYSLPLHFETHIEKLEGAVYNIASDREETSFIELDGTVDTYGSAKIKGSLNTADPKAFTDIGVGFRNLGLDNYSPYSAKFAGRKIDEGKLFVDLNYKIVQSQMLGENSLVIKRIRLGDDIESKDAVNLPLGLAIALLEDSEGIIDIEMPVEGNVDKPDFKYGTVVWKAFTNLIANVATAPFRFLGSLLGIEGDRLEYVEFEPGRTELIPSEVEKLDAIAKAFAKRPRLKLGVVGTYDGQSDRYALQTQKAIALALAELKEKGPKQASELSMDIIEELYEKSLGEERLDKLYDELKKANKEKDAFKRAYRERVWQELVTAQPLAEQELLALALGRSEKIREYLNMVKEVDNQRIRIKESTISEESSPEWIRTKLAIEITE